MASVSVGYVGLYWDEYGQGSKRIFDPQSSPLHRHVPADQLIVYNSTKRVQQLQEIHPYTNQISVDIPTVVVSIDGACRGNGTPAARAAWGVYFGPQSPHNASGILDAALPQTSTRAEIEALSQALDIIRNDVSRDFSLLHYRIRTDSSYLVQTFSQWIESWIDNGGKTSRGKRAAHFEVLKKIHERLDDMTYGDDGGMEFKFWLVPREENKEADGLANEALDQKPGATQRVENTKPRVPIPREENKKADAFAKEALHKAFAAMNTAENAKPRVLSVSLNHREFFDAMYGSLLTKIRAGSVFQRVEDADSAMHMLLEGPRPDAVLITDEALTSRKNALVWDAVLNYVRQGGTAVFMGHFSCFVKPLRIKPFFAKAGLQWESGSYHRTTLVLNSPVVGVGLASKLVPEYSQKAVFLKHAKPSDAWYVTNEKSVTESLVFSAESAHIAGESPVLMARVGEGKLGYIGDVNGEQGSEVAVLTMCGL
ncbi:ribonuclease H-like protein [Trichoderma novae-zelandiae]